MRAHVCDARARVVHWVKVRPICNELVSEERERERAGGASGAKRIATSPELQSRGASNHSPWKFLLVSQMARLFWRLCNLVQTVGMSNFVSHPRAFPAWLACFLARQRGTGAGGHYGPAPQTTTQQRRRTICQNCAETGDATNMEGSRSKIGRRLKRCRFGQKRVPPLDPVGQTTDRLCPTKIAIVTVDVVRGGKRRNMCAIWLSGQTDGRKGGSISAVR